MTTTTNLKGTDPSSLLRILLAEDDRVNQLLISRILQRGGYAVDVVSDGEQVLASLEKNPYDVILMDVQMPNLNGLETTQQIIKNAGKRPLIFGISAGSLGDDVQMYFDAGMDDVLSKSFRMNEFEDLLRKWKKIPA